MSCNDFRVAATTQLRWISCCAPRSCAFRSVVGQHLVQHTAEYGTKLAVDGLSFVFQPRNRHRIPGRLWREY